MTGIFTLSLDFELYWGIRDKRRLDSYRQHLLGGREAIPRILKLFDAYNVHATWATVGFLFFSDREQLMKGLPDTLPAYSNATLSPYDYIAGIGNSEPDDPCRYATDLITQIAAYEGQEIGTHTFSHYYCLEHGQSIDTFLADLHAAQKVAASQGLELRSLVFPRNQWRADYLSACADAGIKAFRGNPDSWIYRAANKAGESRIQRLARLADSYINLSGHNTCALPTSDGGLVNVPASLFLRPVSSRLAVLERLRLRRIKHAMTYAATHDQLFHLWWHPHNFGVNTDANLAFLEAILQHFAALRERHGMAALNMGEVAEIVHGSAH